MRSISLSLSLSLSLSSVLVLVAVMKPKVLKTKISHADPPTLSLPHVHDLIVHTEP